VHAKPCDHGDADCYGALTCAGTTRTSRLAASVCRDKADSDDAVSVSSIATSSKFFRTFSDRLYRLAIEHRPTSDQSTAEMIAINGQIAAAGA
jgi:hypothetical protein